MTHTPASGPLALRTTPPRSVGPTVTAGGCASSRACPSAESPMIAIATVARSHARRVFIETPPMDRRCLRYGDANHRRKEYGMAAATTIGFIGLGVMGE